MFLSFALYVANGRKERGVFLIFVVARIIIDPQRWGARGGRLL